jgi:hypothetical protein
MPTVILGPVKGNRLPSTAVPGSKGSGRPAAQKGGGGNKEAGSKEVTAATAPTVTVSPTGAVTAEHFGPGASARQAARAAVRTQKAQAAHVKRIVALVSRKPDRTPVVAKGTEVKATPAKPQIETRPAISAPPKEAKALAEAIGLGPKTPGGKETSLPAKKGPAASTAILSSDKSAREPRNPRLKGTTQERKAARSKLQKTKAVVRKSQPSLAGLTPIQKEVAQLERKAHKKYPDVPVSVMMGDTEQESNFDPAAASSSAAVGLTQFIPSTAASYGVEEGTGRKEKRSQVFGQAKLLHDLQQEHPGGIKEALGNYYGDPSASYSTEVLEKSAKYKSLDKPGSPKAVANYKAAVTKAKSLGLKVGKPAGDVSAEPGTRTIKVRADAQGMVKWAESVQGTKESTPRQLRWASNEGLGAGEPWCANFVSNGLLRRGITNLPSNPNYVPTYESDWAKYSIGTTDLSKAKPGDLITFSGEHIGLYVGSGEMISGNFGDEVSRDPVSADSTAVSMILRPPYKGGYIKVKETTPLPGSTNPTGSVASSSAPAVVSAVAAPSNPTGSKKQQPKARLSAPQRVAQAEKTLEAGDLAAGHDAATPTTSILDALAKKYGS